MITFEIILDYPIMITYTSLEVEWYEDHSTAIGYYNTSTVEVRYHMRLMEIGRGNEGKVDGRKISSTGKGGENDVASRDLQGGNPRLCRLMTES
jgi:hypothetical protein